ncbi:MAG: hypothetical protein IH984_03265 [Planctomycetes bacterium]|nr:hypothetical protein [Planctomycetota bacterium]
MHRTAQLAFLVGAVSLLVALNARADDYKGASKAEQQSDKERILQLEETNARQQREMDEIRDELHKIRLDNDDQWLTEQRADEIRGLVSDVLADADTRSNLMQNGLTAGWSEHFFLSSTDGRFKLQVSGQQQFRYVWNYHEAPDKYKAGFENTRTKLTLRGHMFSQDLNYLVRGRFGRSGGGLVLEDAWLRYHINSDWNVRFGQFKLPFNREELVSSERQLAVERSIVNESMNIGRSQGVELNYADDVFRASFAFSDAGEDNLGGFNLIGNTSTNSPALTEDTEFAITSRLEFLLAGSWSQFNDFTSRTDEEFGMLFGIGGHIQRDESNGALSIRRNEERWVAWTADLSVEWGGANAFVSFSHHYLDDPSIGQANIYGVVGQAGAYFSPKFEMFTRFEYGAFETTAAQFSELYVITFGGNYYIDGHDIKLTADIGFGISQVENAWDSDLAGWRTDPEGAEPQVVIRGQFQLLF